MTKIIITLMLLAVTAVAGAEEGAADVPLGLDPGLLKGDCPRVRQCFDKGWFFSKGDFEGGDKKSFDHSAWRRLDLPHDWTIEGPYDPRNPCAARGGYLPCGIAWYRKSFRLPAGVEGRKVFVEFDSIYMNGEVWINGHRLGKRPYGYIGVEYDLTPHLDLKGENVLAVRVDNELQPSSRWYTGSGIYRHVWLKVTDELRVAHWGTQVSTPEISSSKAKVKVKTTVINGNGKRKKVKISQTLIDAAGKGVGTISESVKMSAGEKKIIEQGFEIKDPSLWSPESPNMYKLRTELWEGETLADRYDSPLGFRTVSFDPDKGMFLNGKSIIMKGMCNHHDLGPLGAALWDDALERRLVMLKEMGCNSIRTAHNTPCPELLHLCDRLGFMVIDEPFDEWRRGWSFEKGRLVSSKTNKGKAKYGYNRYFEEWAERDLTDNVVRDWNHPCVIMWSIGNEVPEAQRYGENETVKKLVALCHKIDPTRLVTLGCNFIAGANETGFLEHLDVVGYNGGGGSCFQYEADHLKYPKRLMYASEVPHSFQTRGEYRTHSRYREKDHQPANLTEEEVFPETDGHYESSYDNAGVRICARDSWRLTSTLPFLMGEFRWTGFDYHGESGGWPRVIGNFGIIDICNFPKDTYYFYQSRWTDKPMVHILPHWNWRGKEGTPLPVWCYSNGDQVELFLNGKSLGKKKFTKESDMHLEWMVPYAPGELKAVASKGGKVVATKTVRTAGAPAKFALSADRTELELGSRKLSFVTIRVEDAEGNFVPTAENWVRLSVKGPGRLLAVGNGDPMSHESFQVNSVRTFNGLALAIIATKDDGGAGKGDEEIVIKTYSRRLPAAELRIKVKGK